jgi:hypothetical protein
MRSLENRLACGDLPGIACLTSDEDRREILKSYAVIHLEEEIRLETSRFYFFDMGVRNTIYRTTRPWTLLRTMSSSRALYELQDAAKKAYIIPAMQTRHRGEYS